MTKWYINDLELENAIVTARKIDSPWAQSIYDIHSRKAVLFNPNRTAQQFTLDISLRRATRFDMETSIRAELEESPTIYVETTGNYVYENKQECWFVPSGMNVIDKGAERPLSCIISGLIDERTIHSCEFTTGWTGTSITTDSSTRFGSNSIKDTMSTNVDHYTKFTLPSARDVSKADRLHCWIKASQASTWFDTFQIGMSDGSTTILADVSTITADTWSYESVNIEDYSGGNITEFIVKTNPPSATSYDVYIAWVWIE